jgi:hypothetical protein
VWPRTRRPLSEERGHDCERIRAGLSGTPNGHFALRRRSWYLALFGGTDTTRHNRNSDALAFCYTMATKRKRGDDKKILNSPETLRQLLTSAITTHESAQIALLHIMEEYEFSLSALQQILLGLSILFSFSEFDWFNAIL